MGEEKIAPGFESHPDGSGMMRHTQTAMPRRSRSGACGSRLPTAD